MSWNDLEALNLILKSIKAFMLFVRAATCANGEASCRFLSANKREILSWCVKKKCFKITENSTSVICSSLTPQLPTHSRRQTNSAWRAFFYWNFEQFWEVILAFHTQRLNLWSERVHLEGVFLVKWQKFAAYTYADLCRGLRWLNWKRGKAALSTRKTYHKKGWSSPNFLFNHEMCWAMVEIRDWIRFNAIRKGLCGRWKKPCSHSSCFMKIWCHNFTEKWIRALFDLLSFPTPLTISSIE